MSEAFYKKPILNSPYEYPSFHWELVDGLPTHNIVHARRRAQFITPIPKPKKVKSKNAEIFDESLGIDSTGQKYDPISIINEIRSNVDSWRELSSERDWLVTPETARLLKHWRHYEFSGIRPFFCQVEAVEVAIWLTEVAPKLGQRGKKFLDYVKGANEDANPGLLRIALKLATGAGKTTVMSMLIAWQTINAVRQPNSKKFTRGFLVVTPGITIKDRLRVLQANDPESYYQNREIVPNDMLPDLERAKIIITNYHAFKLRERLDVSKGGRALLKGKTGEELNTLETEGQMLQRVMPELMGMKNIMAINDEAHHCYRGKPGVGEDEDLKGDDKKEADKNKEAARLWISGLEIVSKIIGLDRVVDLSATPFFLRGSGYAEGTLFHWTVSDYSLMDAIESGIVKLPRVPVADNHIDREDMPMFRNLWEHIGKDMPKKGRRSGTDYDPHNLPTPLQTALEALYGHYSETSKLWSEANIDVPPCFIVVCNNTSTSKLVYDYISGFFRQNEDGSENFVPGRLSLFSNFDEYGNPLARPSTLLIDSEQLESGDALDKNFRSIAEDEIERFRKEIIERTGDKKKAENITDQDLLREVMNTVGKPDALGARIRCVVSVSMLTEGWDTNTVTHVLGVRAFGTQLLCEQVIGRALRRQSYELNNDNLFNVEYADVLGIPFDFTAKPIVAPPQKPRQTINVRAVRPERDHLEIRFPKVTGYRAELPEERLIANFDVESILELTPKLVGPAIVKNEGIIGEGVELTLEHTADMRRSTLIMHLTKRLILTNWRDSGDEPKLHLFGQLKRITKQWLTECLVCKGGTYPAQLLYQQLADMACSRITAAITKAELERKGAVKAMLDPFNPVGSSIHVNFNTSKEDRWETSSSRSHINWVILDSDWEAEFCRVAESHKKVLSYVKNHSLGFEVPYRYGTESRKYRPDFIVLIDCGNNNVLNLVVEIKGYRGEDAKEKKLTMDTYWVPGVNNLKGYGKWAFVEFADVYAMQHDFENQVEKIFNEMVLSAIDQSESTQVGEDAKNG